MKKVVFMLFILGAFLVNANAGCYIKDVYPGSGPAPDAYCWDISVVASEDFPYMENTSNKRFTTGDHGGSWIYVQIDAYGYNDHTTADISYNNMALYASVTRNNTMHIKLGTSYLFVMDPNSVDNGLIRAKRYSTLKDIVFFN